MLQLLGTTGESWVPGVAKGDELPQKRLYPFRYTQCFPCMFDASILFAEWPSNIKWKNISTTESLPLDFSSLLDMHGIKSKI